MKLLLAGMEDKNNIAMAKRFGIKDILISAMYMYKKGQKYIDDILTNFDFVFLDSGAFTINQKWSELRIAEFQKTFGSKWKEVYDDHNRYMQWRNTDRANELWHEIELMTEEWEEHYLTMLRSDARFKSCESVYCVELDVGSTAKRIERRRRFEAEGFNVVPVLKPDDSKEYVEQVIKEYNYVGFGGIALTKGRIQAKDFHSRMMACRKYMTRVHGFGMTRQEPMRRQPFYSVDSTSWLSGARYGTTYEFNNGKLKVTQDKSRRKQYKRMCEQYGIDYDMLCSDKGTATINEWNMLQWKLYSDWLTQSNMKKAQEYWYDKMNGGELSKMITEDGEVQILGSDEKPYTQPLKSDDEDTVDEDIKDTLPLAVAGETSLAVNSAERLVMGITCTTCIMGENCPLYRENGKCRVDFGKVESPRDFGGLMQYLFTLQKKRITLGAMQEAVDGGIINDSVSREIDRMMKMMLQYKEITDNRDEVTIKAKGTGILAQIFGKKEDKVE